MLRILLLAAVALPIPLTVSAQSPGPAPGVPEPELRLPADLDERLQECFQTDEDVLIRELRKSVIGIDDPENYQELEVLPNGDVIIRRREDAPAYKPGGN